MPIHNWAKDENNIFHDFHNVWIFCLRHILNSGLLPDGYFASTDETAFGYKPDVLALERVSAKGSGHAPLGSIGTSSTLALATAPPRVAFRDAMVLPLPTKKTKRLSIRKVKNEQIVAVIEIVSRANKKESDEFNVFLSKCQMLLESEVHLLIVDLHAPTRRDPDGIHGAIWHRMKGRKYKRPEAKPLTAASYLAYGSLKCFVEPLAVGDPLPEMPLFLDSELYVNVPLEASYKAAFAEVPAHRREYIESLTAA